MKKLLPLLLLLSGTLSAQSLTKPEQAVVATVNCPKPGEFNW